MVRSEGDMSLKIPVTSPEIDAGTVRLVARRLNRYATPGLQLHILPTHNYELPVVVTTTPFEDSLYL
jgi:hypothetical protein